MQPSRSSQPAPVARGVRRIGCVSYLNAKPLIDGLESSRDPLVKFDVPSGLLSDLERGDVDIALCPVIDYFRSHVPLEIVPAGGIGSAAETLTVRVFSRIPLEQTRRVFADTDSHSSVALLSVILRQRFGLRPEVVPYHVREQVAEHRLVEPPETMLLIGDKVVTDSPRAVEYPYQLDLGQAWRDLTGLPFLFAVWMARQDAALGELPALLQRQRLANQLRIQEIAARHAPRHGWPQVLARRYLGSLLQYHVDTAQIQAVQRFAELAHGLGLIQSLRPLRLRRV